jgi:predicted lipoprotein with Yx(FWY)xxD motif
MGARSWMLIVTVTVLAAACGTEAEDGAAAGEAAMDAPNPAAASVAVDRTDLGDVLVDAEGMTLYLFTNDTDGASVCEDDCAAAWPPLIVEGEPVAGEGIDVSLLGTTERRDGGTQVTYGGWPLYRWAQDERPGDTTGQGVQDVWFVVGPDGGAITAAGDGEPVRDGY